MTIDEAIKHCEDVAEEKESIIECLHEEEAVRCQQCVAEHRQLAEWLTELKELREENKVLISECDRLIKEKGELLKKPEQTAEYKRLLKAAVEDFKYLGSFMDEYDDCVLDCSKCPLHRKGINCRCWNKQSEALALIEEECGTSA
jgi:vacuolar-type H+-ATPase subunit I/STV1